MTADMAFLSSGVLSLRLRKSAEHLKHPAFQIAPQKQKSQADRLGERGGQKIRLNVVIFGKVGKANGRSTADLRPMFYQMASLAEPTANLVSMLSPC